PERPRSGQEAWQDRPLAVSRWSGRGRDRHLRRNRRVTVRRLVATLGLALAALGVPATAGAQSYCGGGNGGYSLFAPTGYSAYGGFASFPGGFTSGAV